MSETPPNERVTTRDLILGLHSKVDLIDSRVRSVELTLAREDGASGQRQRSSAARMALAGLAVNVPAAIAVFVALAAR